MKNVNNTGKPHRINSPICVSIVIFDYLKDSTTTETL